MTALPEILITLGLIALLLYLSRRRRGPLVTALLWLGLLAVWLYCAWVTVVLALWAMSPPGIGADNWPELWVNLAVTVGLPVVVLVRWATPGSVHDPSTGANS